jgi:hypothetical protein
MFERLKTAHGQLREALRLRAGLKAEQARLLRDSALAEAAAQALEASLKPAALKAASPAAAPRRPVRHAG